MNLIKVDSKRIKIAQQQQQLMDVVFFGRGHCGPTGSDGGVWGWMRGCIIKMIIWRRWRCCCIIFKDKEKRSQEPGQAARLYIFITSLPVYYYYYYDDDDDYCRLLLRQCRAAHINIHPLRYGCRVLPHEERRASKLE